MKERGTGDYTQGAEALAASHATPSDRLSLDPTEMCFLAGGMAREKRKDYISQFSLAVRCSHVTTS